MSFLFSSFVSCICLCCFVWFQCRLTVTCESPQQQHTKSHTLNPAAAAAHTTKHDLYHRTHFVLRSDSGYDFRVSAVHSGTRQRQWRMQNGHGTHERRGEEVPSRTERHGQWIGTRVGGLRVSAIGLYGVRHNAASHTGCASTVHSSHIVLS